jgi:peptide/nickel transport system substrate-binding protein
MLANSILKKSLFVASCALMLTLLLSSVPNAQSSGVTSKVIGAPLIDSIGQAGGEMITAAASAPFSFNPLVDFSLSTQLVHAGLLEVNPKTSEIEPGVAESFTVSENGQIVTLALREGLTWSDGLAFSSDDVIFTFNDVLQNDAVLQSLAQFGVVFALPDYSVEALDSQTVRFTMDSDGAFQLITSLTFITIIPRSKLAASLPDDFTTAWGPESSPQDIIGLGAFRFSEIQRDDTPDGAVISEINFERNPSFWKVDSAGTQLPYLDRFTQRFIADPNEQDSALADGNIDLLSLGPNNVGQAINLENEAGVEIRVADPFVTTSFITLNQDVEDENLQKLFRDVRFRRAIAHAINRELIMQDILPDRAPYFFISDSFFHPDSPFFDESATAKFEFSLQQANALLNEIGLPDRDGDGIREFDDGSPLHFRMITNDNNPNRIATGEFLRDHIAAIGVQIDFEALPFQDFAAAFDIGNRQMNVDAAILAFGLGPSTLTSPNYLNCQFSSNQNCHLHRYSDSDEASRTPTQARIDEIFQIVDAQDQSTSERNALLTELQQLISNDLAQIPLWKGRSVTVFRPNIENVQSITLFGLTASAAYIWKT